MIRGPFFVSPHAVRRCVERIYPRFTYEQARDWLILACESAHYVKPSPGDKGQVWRASRAYGRVRLFVEQLPARRRPTLMTVLPECDRKMRVEGIPEQSPRRRTPSLL